MEKKDTLILKIGAGIILLAIAFTGWWIYQQKFKPQKDAVRQQQAELQTSFSDFVDLKGNSVALDAADGRVKVVTHWASWCPQCLDDWKVVQEVSREVDLDKVTFIAVNRKEPVFTIESYLNAYGLSVIDGVTVVVDTTDRHYAQVGGYTMPETVLYDQAGKNVEQIRTTLTKESLLEAINKNLTQ